MELPGEPGQEDDVPRRDWKDTLAAATDIALIGFFVVFACLAVVTIGSAAATGSYAVRYWIAERRTPPIAECWRLFLRWLLPGTLATFLLAAVGWVMALNVTAMSRGLVPGGPAALVATGILIAWLAAMVVLALIHLGRWPGDGWLAAARWSARVAVTVPHRALVLVAVAALAALLAVMVQAASPLLAGYGLFAVHVVADRLLPGEPEVE